MAYIEFSDVTKVYGSGEGEVRALDGASFEVERGELAVILGASGAGKSWIACALGVAACNAFFSVRYVRLPEMLDELNVSKNEDWLKAKKRYTKCDLLILDDWLLEKLEGKAARELLEIVEARLRSGSLLICSQFSPAGWHSKLGEGAIADAVIDRIVYRSDVIHIEGDESMRKRIG